MSAPTDRTTAIELSIFKGALHLIIHRLDKHSRFQYPTLTTEVDEFIELFKMIPEDNLEMIKHLLLTMGTRLAQAAVVCIETNCENEAMHHLMLDVAELIIDSPTIVGRTILDLAERGPVLQNQN